MAVYAKDAKDVSSSAQSLVDLIVGGKQKRDMQAQAEQSRMAELGEQDRLGRSRQAYDVEQAEALRKTLPQGSSVRLGEASINTPDPLSNFLKAQDQDAKARDDSRMETAALQGEFKKLGGNDPDRLRAYDDIEGNINDVNVNNVGQLRAMLARGVEKGVLTDQDIQRYLPSSLGGDIKKGLGYLGIGAGELGQVITPEQKASIVADIKSKRENMIKAQEAAARELRGRAPMLAPTLHKAGSIEKVMGSLGGTARDASANAQTKVVGGVTYRKVPGGWEEVK